MYDEIWTAGKGSYKLQRPGVLEDGAEIILYAPHITAFHSNPVMDSAIRRIGYHSLKWVLDFCKKHPDFDKNVASHVVNVRGPGSFNGLTEHCAFSITLATGIAEQDCRAVGLNYCDPNSLRPSDFNETGRLWIPDGGKWLYARK
jgi:nickel-dependent lactate racemase